MARGIVPLYGHVELRERLREAAGRNALPGTLLFQGMRGVGKQRLALWLAQLLLCERAGSPQAPCGACTNCRFALELTHPDLQWFFPRPRSKNSDPDIDDVRADSSEAIRDRVVDGGLYPPPSGSEGIYIATVRAIVQQAALSPAIARRKVFIIGDAERMVSQEGSDQAANAFLKLLEEPPADTTVILTSSEPGALLPTVRSRVVTWRVPPLASEDVRSFLHDDIVTARLDDEDGVPKAEAERIVFAAGAPGRLLSGTSWALATANARRMLEAATGRPAMRYEAAWGQASTKARGSFADTLDALTVALHERAREAVKRGAETAALAASRAIERVEVAKERVTTNVSPQLITVNLIRELQELLT
jgi:DNA polymerase-3 subunit delta'